MVFGWGKPRILKPEEAIAIIAFLGKALPGSTPPELTRLDFGGDATLRDDYLRRVYLEVEERVVAARVEGFSDAATIRRKLRDRFHLSRVVPSRFTVLFLDAHSQAFFLFRIFLESVWAKAGWEPLKVQEIIRFVAGTTAFSKLTTFSEEEWRDVFDDFLREGQAALLDAFRRIFDRTFQELVRERGESRARLLVEEVLRSLQRDWGMLDAITVIRDVLPEGIFEQERITLASREELAETVERQMQELRGKNIALVAEAAKLRETIEKLETAKAQLEAMASAQRDFINVVSHQFRTPLAAIRWEAQAILDAVAGKPDCGPIAEMADGVYDRSSFLIGVLENIFDLLAIESGTFRIVRQPTDLRLLVERGVAEFAKAAARKRIALRAEVAVSSAFLVSADAGALMRVLAILLTNAIQYTPDGGSVEVIVEQRDAPSGGEEAVVRVRDSGIGIRQEDRPRIFEKFFRAKNAIAMVPDGAGIALYIAKRIVELHGGKMWAESVGTGMGSTFSFTMPMEHASESPPVERSDGPVAQR